MHKTPLIVTAAMVLGLAVSASAMAGQKGPGHGRMFDRLDKDNNGAITNEEAQAARIERFGRLDSNGDGVISIEEFQVIGADRFARMDLNGDGQVTRDEAAQARRQHRKRQVD